MSLSLAVQFTWSPTLAPTFTQWPYINTLAEPSGALSTVSSPDVAPPRPASVEICSGVFSAAAAPPAEVTGGVAVPVLPPPCASAPAESKQTMQARPANFREISEIRNKRLMHSSAGIG